MAKILTIAKLWLFLLVYEGRFLLFYTTKINFKEKIEMNEKELKYYEKIISFNFVISKLFSFC